ncbi:NAD(P)-binding domain-containing protein [Nonomuraea sp. NPDC049695]|uniref:NAD(P)-binding domain-containing protein n=1 Tax=Nonomuraea sp. NPDC049695 TaxID=3154734 RepID=UPI00341CD0E9
MRRLRQDWPFGAPPHAIRLNTLTRKGETIVKIAVLGTGMVGRALADRLSTLGHDVVIGTRDVEQTLARTEPDRLGNGPFAQWRQTHPAVRLLSFADAGAHGEVIVNATQGAASLAAFPATTTSSSRARTPTPRRPSRACCARSAGPRRRSWTSAASAPPARQRCTRRCSSRSRPHWERTTSTSRSSARNGPSPGARSI